MIFCMINMKLCLQIKKSTLFYIYNILCLCSFLLISFHTGLPFTNSDTLELWELCTLCESKLTGFDKHAGASRDIWSCFLWNLSSEINTLCAQYEGVTFILQLWLRIPLISPELQEAEGTPREDEMFLVSHYSRSFSINAVPSFLVPSWDVIGLGTAH